MKFTLPEEVPSDLVIITLPVVAPTGTLVIMILSFQLDIVADVPLKVTEPDVDPKQPVIDTTVPTGPEVGEILGGQISA